MREIKFRVWDTKRNRWLDISQDQELLTFNWKAADPTSLWLCDKSIDNSRLIFLWDTGLKDKNGKDIYDGDIVRFWTKDVYDEPDTELTPANCYEQSLWYISWNPCGRWQVGLQDGFCHCLGENVYEVVGNIYDNFELLLGYDEK